MTRERIVRKSTGRPLAVDEAAEYRRKIAEEQAGAAATLAEIAALKRRRGSHEARLRAAVDQLRAKRIDQGLSVAELASLIGVDEATVAGLEGGENLNPTLDLLHRYAHALGMSLAFSVVD